MERPIKELLIIMRDNIELFEKYECNGLCDLSTRLETNETITRDERDNLRMFIKLNMPVRLPYGHQSAWGWQPYLLQPRLEWLNEQINLL